MPNLPANNRKNPGFWKGLIIKLKIAWLLFKDEKVPTSAKLVPIVILLYLISPADFLPDFFPILGQIDDLTLIVFGLDFFISVSPKTIVESYRNKFGK